MRGALWASPPGVLARIAPLLATAAILWAAPVLLGALLYGVATLASPGEAALGLLAIAIALIFSPLLSWIGWAFALPAVWLLLRRGMFGWLPAGIVGLASGAVAGALTDSAVAIPFAILSLLALRAALPVAQRA